MDGLCSIQSKYPVLLARIISWAHYLGPLNSERVNLWPFVDPCYKTTVCYAMGRVRIYICTLLLDPIGQ